MLERVIYFFLLSILVSCGASTKKSEVNISGRQIIVNDSPYIIKGICYHPVPKGSDQRDFSSLTEDLALMVEAGINTIRVYAPILEKAILDEIEASGLKVIIGFGYNQLVVRLIIL